MRTRLVTMAMGIMAVGVPAYAQTNLPEQASATASFIDPVGGLTLDDAIARALQNEPGLQALRARVDVTRGLREQAGLRPNPSISFFQQQEPGGTDRQTRLELQWPLDLFRKAGRTAVADREIEMVQETAADGERTLAGDVRMKYGELAAAVRMLSVTEQVLAATTRQRGLVASQVDQGATPPIERDMLRVEERRLEADRVLQAGVADRRMIELKRLLGMPFDAPLTLRETLEGLVQRDARPPSDPSSASTARPDVREAEARVRTSEAEIDRAHREGRADVSLVGAYMRMDAGFPQQGLSPGGEFQKIRGVFHYVSAGAMVTLPVLNRNQGGVAAAEAERRGAVARLEATRLAAQNEIGAARSREEHARRALEAYSGEAIALATQNLSVVRQTYQLGRGTLLDVLSEQRRYLDLERTYTDVLREAYEARQGLWIALGGVR